MSLNILNKIYVVISIGIICTIAYNIINYKSWDRYYYDATATAPSSFPVHVRECYFLNADEDDDAYVRTENVNNHISQWGDEGDFLQLYYKRRLPEKLVISYFAYREKTFYKDTLVLPTAQIEQLFKEAIKNDNAEKYYSYKNEAKGLNFTIGLANNGNLLIWVRGINLEKLILKTQLKPREPAPEDRYYETTLSKEAYFVHAFEGIEDSVKVKLNSGFDANANYADSATHYLERNKKLWKYQKSNGIID